MKTVIIDGIEIPIADKLYDEIYSKGFKDSQEKYYDEMMSAVGLFIVQCGEMAEKNWCTSQVDMLHRLFGAVLSGKEYAEWEPEK